MSQDRSRHYSNREQGGNDMHTVVGGGYCSLVSKKVFWLHVAKIRPSWTQNTGFLFFFSSLLPPMGLYIPLKAIPIPASRTQLPAYQVGNFNILFGFCYLLILERQRERRERDDR